MDKEKIVCVEWDDASYNSGYYTEARPESFEPVKTRTVGFLVKKTKGAIVISHDRFYMDDKLDDERHITTVPKKMIVKVTELHG